MQDTAGEQERSHKWCFPVETLTKAGWPAEQKQGDQLELTYSSFVRIRNIPQKTCQKRWTIGRSGERGSEISVLAARHSDDDDYVYIFVYKTRKLEIVFQNKFISVLLAEQISSSLSYRVGSTDIPDPLSPLLPIVHHPRQVFRTASRILT